MRQVEKHKMWGICCPKCKNCMNNQLICIKKKKPFRLNIEVKPKTVIEAYYQTSNVQVTSAVNT